MCFISFLASDRCSWLEVCPKDTSSCVSKSGLHELMEWSYEPIPDGGPLVGGVRPVRQRASSDASQRGVRHPAVLVLVCKVCMEDESHVSHTCRLLRACVEVDKRPHDVARPGQENHVVLLAKRSFNSDETSERGGVRGGVTCEVANFEVFALSLSQSWPSLAGSTRHNAGPGYLTVMGRTEGELSSFQDWFRSACLLGASFRLTSDARFVLVPARLVQRLRDKCAAQANQPV